MVSSVSSLSPPAAKPAPKSTRSANARQTVIPPQDQADSIQASKNKPVRFGGNEQPSQSKGGLLDGLKKGALATLGATSAGGFLLAGLPLGLAQMALGLFFHPLLITGALTMGLPLAGVAASYLLWPGKK